MSEDQDAPLPDIVAAAIRLAPAVRAASDEAESMRQTPPGLAAEITRAGIYQMYLPRSMGGPETPPLTAFRVVEELSRCDGSVGWCAMIATALSLSVGRLPVEVGRELAGSPADYRAAGSARPGGRAWDAPGGYRVTGRWNFASGIQNARWLDCTSIMMDGDTPLRNTAGAPVLRVLWVPRESVTIVDTWSVMGMRGTGSQDFTVEDVFVPAVRSCLSDVTPRETGPLYHPRAWYVNLWTPSAGNALGIARGAIDSLAAIAATEATTMSPSLLRDRPLVQTRIAEADAIVNAARAYVFDAVGRLGARCPPGRRHRTGRSHRGGWRWCMGCTRRSRRSTRCFTPPAPMRSMTGCRWSGRSGTYMSRCSTRLDCRAISVRGEGDVWLAAGRSGLVSSRGSVPAPPVAEGLPHDQVLIVRGQPGQFLGEHRHALTPRARHFGNVGAPEHAVRTERVVDLAQV